MLMRVAAAAIGAVLACLALSSAHAATQSPPAGYAVSDRLWDENFTSPSLDTSKWNPGMGDDRYGAWRNNGKLPAPYSGMNCGNSTCSDGLSNPYYDPYPYGYNVVIDRNHLVGGGGKLSIIGTPSNHFASQGYRWATAGIATYQKYWLPAEGGYVQVRAKIADSRYGAWNSIWLLSNDGPEIDLQESGYTRGTTNANRVLAVNFHCAGCGQVVKDTGVDLSAGYHMYGMEYRSGQSIKLYLDGQLQATYTSNIPSNAKYQLILDMEFATSSASGWHTVGDPTRYPGPYQFDIENVQMYGLPSSSGGDGGADTTAPSTPTGLTATSASATEINLAWNASTDNVAGPITYDVYRDGGYLNYSTATAYRDSAVSPGTTYRYNVLAYDQALNLSPLSAPITVAAAAPEPPQPAVMGEGSPVVTKAKTNVLSRAGRGSTVCSQPTGMNGTTVTAPVTVSGAAWVFVIFTSGCPGWLPQSSLNVN